MRKALLGLAVFSALFVVSGASAQTTYTATNVPFRCSAATAGKTHLSFSMFVCRGIFFDNNAIELFFGAMFEVSTPSYRVGPYNVTQSLTNFTQPDPYACPVSYPGYKSGCPAGTVPGTLELNWSGTDGSGVQHNGTISATWENIQTCGGERCWYYPVLESAQLTINQ